MCHVHDLLLNVGLITLQGFLWAYCFFFCRFDYNRIPNTWWANEDFPPRSDLVDEKGIDRGTEEYVVLVCSVEQV